MRVVFMGTPTFAARILQGISIDDNVDIVGVYTNADAVRGRGNKLVASPVKLAAKELGIDVFTPNSFKEESEVLQLQKLQPDFIVAAAYGMVLPESVLQTPKYECLNVHGSLLPRWRGAAPIQRAIMAGDRQTGVSIMRMEAGLDTGQYCLQYPFEIGQLDFAAVEQQMALDGITGLLKAMNQIVDGSVEWHNQDESCVTIAEKLQKRELWLDPIMSAQEALRLVRASNEAHVSKCVIGGKTVSILSANLAEYDGACGLPSGSVEFTNKCLFLGFTSGALRVVALKPDGKKTMDAASFASGVQNIKKGGVTWSGCN